VLNVLVLTFGWLATSLAPGLGPDAAQDPEPVYSSDTPGVDRPLLIESDMARYTALGEAAHLVGLIAVEAVVRADGTVTDARVIESCLVHPGSYPWPTKAFFDEVLVMNFRGYMAPERCREVDERRREVLASTGRDETLGLTQEALEAAAKWAFKPAQKDGVAVAYRVVLGFTFGLRSP
jgi:hypothetical protein